MNTQNYKKPELKFVSLRNEESVANTCWGHHGTDTNLFCDISGKGFVSFQIAAGSCSLNLINVQYYGEDTNGDGKITTNDTPVKATAEQIAELDQRLRESGGDSGNPFKGEGDIVIPGTPDPSWS